ncbi:hypothetical protein SAMN05660909_04601 [Chitinophaga terrae (ex Kim and Jung 2007)]|uniref:DUF4919 domain-containing protein n=1 Tax=Chitinophaga terrae (ex Kim and Jung 2007) TaxID=408074 RepID=A0A1H4FRI6_9BACT|nr:hypothetical protein [Chitinophaga terrae (ex Kim and Jung 2007)]MDQ0109649.1 hypothetical protein [Chitinophaga terrae (ex Kim and Jung 2007)]SEA99430.1 hypothetical protein SAMN05660909_04601 [Chitinophaga terrae (ex Kim and Jung 2007)]
MRMLMAGLLMMASLFVNAQDEYPKPSKESLDYNVYRTKVSVPPYGLAKVKAMIAKLTPNDEEIEKLPDNLYNSLSLREKFTYNMIHGEIYSQNCDPMPPVEDEHKKIFAQLPGAFDEYSWSDKQTQFFDNNRDSVIALIKESVTRSKRVGVNYKEAIVSMNAVEIIPFLEEVYLRDKKDHDILTVFLLLMKANKYQPFLASSSFKKLYGDDANYGTHIVYNSANEQLILQRVNDFYKNYKR